MSDVTPEAIAEQREKGWPDFHPEDYCHKCGRPNIPAWTSPEWVQVTGSHGGILCPVCFAAHDPDAIWVVARWQPPDADRVGELAALLRVVSDLGDDSERVARCVADYLAVKERPIVSEGAAAATPVRAAVPRPSRGEWGTTGRCGVTCTNALTRITSM